MDKITGDPLSGGPSAEGAALPLPALRRGPNLFVFARLAIIDFFSLTDENNLFSPWRKHR